MKFQGNELYFCPECLVKGRRTVMKYEMTRYFACPVCYCEFWPGSDITPRQVFKLEQHRPHQKGGGSKSGGKRKKPNKFVRAGEGYET